MKKSFLEGLDSYLEDFEGKMIAEENLSPAEPNEDQRPVRTTKPSRHVSKRIPFGKSTATDSQYEIVEEQIVVVKSSKPKVKKIVETDERGNILNVRYVPIEEDVDPNDLFGKVGSILDETGTDTSYLNEGVMTSVPDSGSNGDFDMFIPAPMPGQIEGYSA